VEAAVDRSDASALADLQMHWDEAYAIGLDGDIWRARFHGTSEELRAHTSTELRELIRTDYSYRRQAQASRIDGNSIDGTGHGDGPADADDPDDASPGDRSYRDHYDDEQSGTAGARREAHASYAKIRGERMST
jgi:hypothetical protein